MRIIERQVIEHPLGILGHILRKLNSHWTHWIYIMHKTCNTFICTSGKETSQNNTKLLTRNSEAKHLDTIFKCNKINDLQIHNRLKQTILERPNKSASNTCIRSYTHYSVQAKETKYNQQPKYKFWTWKRMKGYYFYALKGRPGIERKLQKNQSENWWSLNQNHNIIVEIKQNLFMNMIQILQHISMHN